MTTNLYLGSGECENCCDEVLHHTIDFALSEDIGFVFREVIPCPAGKRVAILMGRIESKDECKLSIFNGDRESSPWGDTPLMLDVANLPDENYLLPPTTPNQAHFRTGAGRGLWFWGQTAIATTEPRSITGYLKYCLLEAVPLGDALWGDMDGLGDCYPSPVLIQWPPVVGAELYRLEKRQIVGEVAGAWSVIYEDSNPFFEDESDGGMYEYRFMAFNEDDHSDYSPGSRFNIKPTFNFTLTCPETMCSIYWGDVPGAYKFRVYRDDELIATTTYQGIADPIERGQIYTYRVEAQVAGNCFKAMTNTIDLSAPCTPPTFTLGLSRDGQEIYLYWGEIAGATQFKIYRNDVLIDTIDGTRINTGDYVAAISATYTYKVVAYLTADCFGEATDTIDVVIDVFVPFSMDAFDGVNHLYYWRNNTHNKARLITLEPEAISSYVPPYLDMIKGVMLFYNGGSGIGLTPATEPFKLRDEAEQPIDMQKLRLVWNYPPNVYLDGAAIPPFWHNYDGDGFHPQALAFILGTLGNDLALKVESVSLPQNNGFMITTQRQETWGNAWFYLIEGQGEPFGAMDVNGAVWGDGYQGLFPYYDIHVNDKENGLCWLLGCNFPIRTLSLSANGVYISFQINNPLNDEGNSFGGYQEPCYITMELFNGDLGTQLAWGDYLVGCRVHNINGGRTSIVGGYIRTQAWNSLIQYRQPRDWDYLVPTYIEWRHTA